MNQADKKICIWVLSDGKPGHYNQTEGLVQALSKYRKVELVRMPVISRSSAFLVLLLKRCSGINGNRKNKPDLIMGAGHQTHLSLFAYRYCFGGKVVTMMSPSLPSRWFDLCLIPKHDMPKKSRNIVETFGALNRVVPSQSRRINSGLIMLGGPSKHFKWVEDQVLQQIELLLSNSDQVEWIIANSRRTPESINNKILSQFPEVIYVLAEDVSAEWLPEKMQGSERIWVTEDSVSMIYEALTAGARTGVIRLPVEKQTRVTKEIGHLISDGYLSTVDKRQNNNISTKEFGVLYEADRCAKLLLEKFDL